MALTLRQLSNGFFNNFKSLRLLKLVGRRLLRVGVSAGRQSFQGIVIIIFVSSRQRGYLCCPQIADFLTAKMIAHGVLQNALKKHRQFVARTRRVLLGEFHHRVLHNIERKLFVAYGEKHLFERTTLDRREKVREFLTGSQ